MISWIVGLLILGAMAETTMVTQSYTDYLKQHVSWEVVDYEDNVFKGWTTEEFDRLLGDWKDAEDELPPATGELTTLPEGANCQHEIRNQGNCGSCWAFAVASMISDNCCRAKQDYGWLAPQELVACAHNQCEGCNGGTRSTAIDYVIANGLVPEACYPYVARDTSCPTKCNDGKDWKAAHVCQCKTRVDCGKQPSSWTECLKKGAIAAGMLVYSDFSYYKSGIYCWDKKSAYRGGHAIRCVGAQDKALICANSWGTGWGDQGYFKISTEANCGLNFQISNWICTDYA